MGGDRLGLSVRAKPVRWQLGWALRIVVLLLPRSRKMIKGWERGGSE
jgi:hypothetical protein